jgi:hypothetical protein
VKYCKAISTTADIQSTQVIKYTFNPDNTNARKLMSQQVVLALAAIVKCRASRFTFRLRFRIVFFQVLFPDGLH